MALSREINKIKINAVVNRHRRDLSPIATLNRADADLVTALRSNFCHASDVTKPLSGWAQDTGLPACRHSEEAALLSLS
jgi:hypothetical protein